MPEFYAVAPEAEVERRRREDRGAEGAEGGKVWGGGAPVPTGERSRKFFHF